MKTGCLIAGGLAVLLLAGVIVLVVTSDADGLAPSLDFEDCSRAQAAHLERVYQAVYTDREKFFDFDGIRRLSGSDVNTMKLKLMRVWPLELTCAVDNNCPYGANSRGWVVGGEAKLTLCAYTEPDENDCDTYAAIAFANAYTRGLWDREAAGFFAYARQMCMARGAF